MSAVARDLGYVLIFGLFAALAAKFLISGHHALATAVSAFVIFVRHLKPPDNRLFCYEN